MVSVWRSFGPSLNFNTQSIHEVQTHSICDPVKEVNWSSIIPEGVLAKSKCNVNVVCGLDLDKVEGKSATKVLKNVDFIKFEHFSRRHEVSGGYLK